MIKREDIDKLFQQINKQSFKPTRIMMHPDTFRQLLTEPLYRLYSLILRHGFKVMEVTEDRGSYTIKLEKWLHWSYEPNRVLEEEITLFPEDWKDE